MQTSTDLRLTELRADSEPETILQARELLLEYGRFVQAQPGVASFCFGALEKEAAQLPASYLGQGGGAMLAYPGAATSTPAGFVAWRTLPLPELASAWEVKRLWVRPEARGRGVSRELMGALIARARAANKSQLLLDTAPDAMAAAHRLYVELGFVECPAYFGAPIPGILYMRLQIEP
jgi:putative acetyltransferase